MIIKSVLNRENNSLEELTQLVLNTGKDTVREFKLNTRNSEENFNDGI